MSGLPLISVVTPTWQRGDLLKRAIDSVQAQSYPKVEHIIVSDGPDPELGEKLGAGWSDPARCRDLRGNPPRRHPVWYYQLDEHEPDGKSPFGRHWGHLARARGTELAAGELIAYCDDDDALRPEHCSLLAHLLLARPDCGFAISRMVSHQPEGDRVIGHGTPVCGNLGTPMIMHRRGLLDIAAWDRASPYEDWELVLAWMNADVAWCTADAETADVWPSHFRL